MGEIQSGGVFSEIKKKAQFIVEREIFFFSITHGNMWPRFSLHCIMHSNNRLLFLITKFWVRSSVADIVKSFFIDMSVLKVLLFISFG